MIAWASLFLFSSIYTSGRFGGTESSPRTFPFVLCCERSDLAAQDKKVFLGGGEAAPKPPHRRYIMTSKPNVLYFAYTCYYLANRSPILHPNRRTLGRAM